jgi:regulator of nonsense transcripts 1
MNYLDQWLQYVETEDVLPLFEKEELEYRLPKLDNVNWEDYSANVVMVVRDRSLAHLKQIDAMADIQTIFQLLLGHDEKAYLREVYTHLLNLEACGSLSCNSEALASMQLGFLLQAPYLIPTFLQSQTWRKHKENLEYELERHGPALLSQLVLAANDLKVSLNWWSSWHSLFDPPKQPLIF